MKNDLDMTKWQTLPPVVALGFERSVESGAHASIESETCVKTLIRELVIDPECAPHFTITGITVGRYNLIIGAQGIPASFFSGAKCTECNLATVRRMVGSKWPTMHAGTCATLHVINNSNARQMFKAAFEVIDLTTLALANE